MTRNEILSTAKQYVCGDRDMQYGTPEDSFGEIAALWQVYLDCSIDSHDVAIMMALFKIARIKTGTQKDDSYIDACGYLACAGEISSSKE